LRFPFNISATAEASDFTFGMQLGFAKRHHKSLQEKKWAWPWTRGAPQNLGFLFNIFAMTEGWQAGGFRQGPSHGSWARELPKISGFPFNISATAEASDFKFGVQLGFAKPHHKITPRGKVGVALS